MSEANAAIESLLSQFTQPGATPLTQIMTDVINRLTQDDEPDFGRHVAKLAKTLRRLRKERDLLIERNRTIALGLGACECWGADPHCAKCYGEGTPGYFMPEQPEFLYLVLPLLESRMELISSYLQNIDGQPEIGNQVDQTNRSTNHESRI